MMPFYNKSQQPCGYQTWEKCTKQVNSKISQTDKDWLTSSCGVRDVCNSPPPAHQHGNHPLLWRVKMEVNPHIELWQEQSQEMFTISFQDIVDILMKDKKQKEAECEHNEQVDDSSSDISGVPKKPTLEEELSDTTVNSMTCQLTRKRKLTQESAERKVNDDTSVVQETQLIDSQVGQANQVLATKSVIRSGGNSEVDIKTILKDIDRVLEETSTVIESIVENHFDEQEVDKEENPAAEDNLEDSGTEMKERQSNSDRCRLFRKKSKRTRKTNEELLLKLEKRNETLNEAEKRLMSTREVLQTQYLNIVKRNK